MRTKDKPCRKLRDIILDWPEPPVPFPKRIALPEDPPFPLLMAPYRGGFQCMYDPTTDLFHWPHAPPLWMYFEVKSPYVLMGETFRPEMLAPEYLIKYLLNNLAGTDFQLSASFFQINDTGEQDKNGTVRAGHVVNLAYAGNPPEVYIPTMYQASSPETFNKYLQSFQQQGLLGTICRPLDPGPSEDQFIALNSIPL
jgi:hypothetical protein